MNKNSLTSGIMSAFLSAGLISCADKDRVVRDDFNASAPVIVTEEGSQDLKVFESRSGKTLALQSAIDVSAARASKLRVSAHCRVKGRVATGVFDFQEPTLVKIFQLIPAEFLTTDLEKEVTECQYELALFNQIGSKHIYAVGLATIKDSATHGVRLEKSANSQPINHKNPILHEGLRARFRNEGSARAQVVCKDVSFPDLPFEQLIELSNFDYGTIQTKPNAISAPEPVQSCRIFVRQNSALIQISPVFMVYLPQPRIDFSVFPGGSNIPAFKLFSGETVGIGHATFKNTDAGSIRYLNVPKAAGPSALATIYEVPTANAPKIDRTKFHRHWSKVLPVAQAGVTIEDRGDYWNVAVPAGFTQFFALNLQPPGPIQCAGRVVPHPQVFAWYNFTIYEVTVSGHPLRTHHLLMNEVQFGNLSMRYFHESPTSEYCKW